MTSALAELYAERVCMKKRTLESIPESLRAEVASICKSKCPRVVGDV